MAAIPDAVQAQPDGRHGERFRLSAAGYGAIARMDFGGLQRGCGGASDRQLLSFRCMEHIIVDVSQYTI